MYELNYHHADEILKSPQGHPLFIGDAAAAEDVEWLKQNDIHTGNLRLMAVISVVSGFNFSYDPSVKQIKYNLEDKKTENISAYFDMAALQIDKCSI